MARRAAPAAQELDYVAARVLLAEAFRDAEADVAADRSPAVPDIAAEAADRLFAASVQSYREALLGCALARKLNPDIDIRLPYVGHGARAFNGRTLDEQVINPFLKEHAVPSSKGPYLASFRRSVRFVPETGGGLRDQASYAAMLDCIGALEQAHGAEIDGLLRYLCARFVLLRDRSRVPLVQVIRMTLDQQSRIIGQLLATRSGGRFPVFLTAAMFETLRDRFALRWDVGVQGINTADAATGAGGDIVVTDRDTGETVVAVEITERPIDRDRIVSTFASKIATNRIAEYLFFYTATEPTEDAKRVAFGYFAQGHDIAFLRVDEWLRNCLGIVGAAGRGTFTRHFVRQLDSLDVPSTLKLRWNELAANLARLDHA